jgi:hypothetical protein
VVSLITIEEFFQLSAGRWFSHRSSHDLASKQSKNGKSELTIEALGADHPDLVKLSKNHNIDPSDASCGIKIVWNGTIETEKQKQIGSTVLVAVPDKDNPSQGKLLQQTVKPETNSLTVRYLIGDDDALTLTTESGNMCLEERLWFASPNLRMRATVLKRSGEFSMTSFTSEIRMMAKTPEKASETSKSASS